MSERYTDKAYWEDYYQKSKTSREHIKDVCSDYDKFWDKLVTSCARKPQSIIEIGAYPGRYIAYLGARYGLEATALDFNSDKSKIEEAFKIMNVKTHEIIQADFLNYKSDKQYDLVISNGFIEHFENYDEVLDLHCKYLAPGGAMFIMIPNKRFLRKWYGLLCDYENLKAHNLKAMKLSVFKKFAKRNDLQIAYLNYYGGFPFSVHQKLNWIQKQIHRLTRYFFKKINHFIENRPNKYLSSTILGIYKKDVV